MKRLKLLFIVLCLAVISAQAQVVFSEDEKNFVVSQVTTPIQNAAPKSILSEHRIEFACNHIHLHVLSPNLLRHSHPSHQQVPFYRIFL